MVTQSLPRHVELSAEGLAEISGLTACDREPIHLSGAIQPHGLLLVLDQATMWSMVFEISSVSQRNYRSPIESPKCAR
jgi:hypothetical protein